MRPVLWLCLLCCTSSVPAWAGSGTPNNRAVPAGAPSRAAGSKQETLPQDLQAAPPASVQPAPSQEDDDDDEEDVDADATPPGCLFSWLCYLPPKDLPEPLEKNKVIIWIASAFFPPIAAALAPKEAGVKLEGPVLRTSVLLLLAMWLPVLLIPVVFLAIIIPFYTFILTIPAMVFYMGWAVFSVINLALMALWFAPVNMLHVMARNAHPEAAGKRARKTTTRGTPAGSPLTSTGTGSVP